MNNKADYSYYAVGYDNAGYTSYVTYPNGHGGFLDPNQQFTANDSTPSKATNSGSHRRATSRCGSWAGCFTNARPT